MAVVLLQPLVFLLQPPRAVPVVPPAPAFCGWLCYRGGLTAPILLPPLARPSLHSLTPPVILRRRQPHTAAEPVNPRTPLRAGFHYCVSPGSASSSALVRSPCAMHRRLALSTWSTTERNKEMTVRGEDDSRDPPVSWQYASKCERIEKRCLEGVIRPSTSKDSSF